MAEACKLKKDFSDIFQTDTFKLKKIKKKLSVTGSVTPVC